MTTFNKLCLPSGISRQGHRQALFQVHHILRHASMTTHTDTLLAVAAVANLTQHTRARPYETLDSAAVPSTSTAQEQSEDPDESSEEEQPCDINEQSSSSEGVLVIDLQENSDSDTVEYVPEYDNISD